MSDNQSVSSYEVVDYRLRPAKHIERKMLCEALQRLSQFAPLEQYRYVGLGSIYFSDFSLIHKRLGIIDLVSFEKDEDKRERFEFNKPFHCIDIQFGISTLLLPKLCWEPRTIAWLDYDYPLKPEVLRDVSCFMANAISGSVLIVTVDTKLRVDTIKTVFENNPDLRNTPTSSRHSWDIIRYREYCRNTITNQIQTTLFERNGALKSKKRLNFNQLFNFHYSDGTPMLTIGGLLHSTEDVRRVEACNFSNLPFVRCDERPYSIEVPKLTIREIHYLESQLPMYDEKTILEGPMSDDDRRRYAKIYRYFPVFTESDI